MDGESRRLMGVLGGVLAGAGLVGVMAVQGARVESRRLPAPARTPTLVQPVSGLERTSLEHPQRRPDEAVRAAAGISDHPRLEALLGDGELVPRLVAAVEALAEGRLPAGAADDAPAAAEMLVWRAGDGRLLVAPGTHRRYAGLVEVLESVEPGELAAAYRRLAPQLEDAYRALPGRHASFDEAARRALARLRGAPLPERALEVERSGWQWVLADPSLAALAPAEQQMVLMGRAHAHRAHAVLDAVGAALGWDEVPAPPPQRLAGGEPGAVDPEPPVVLARTLDPGAEPIPVPGRTSQAP